MIGPMTPERRAQINTDLAEHDAARTEVLNRWMEENPEVLAGFANYLPCVFPAQLMFQCRDCQEVFTSMLEMAGHTVEECCERGNHQMYETSFGMVEHDAALSWAVESEAWRIAYLQKHDLPVLAGEYQLDNLDIIYCVQSRLIGAWYAARRES